MCPQLTAPLGGVEAVAMNLVIGKHLRAFNGNSPVVDGFARKHVQSHSFTLIRPQLSAAGFSAGWATAWEGSHPHQWCKGGHGWAWEGHGSPWIAIL